MSDKSVEWDEIFQVERHERESDLETRVPGACNEKCMMAGELKCVCQCGGANYGTGLRRNVKPLDEFNEEACDHVWVWLIGRSSAR